MAIEIDFNSERTHSKNVFFEGETESGLKFTINANWNEYDGWNLEEEDILWDDEEGTEEEIQEIIDNFLNEINR